MTEYNNMLPYIIIFLVSVLVSAFSQIILKKSAEIEYKDVLHEYLNPRVIIAYSMFVVSTLLTLYAYKGIPLSLGPLLEAVGYIYIPVLSYIFLKEKLTPKKMIGSIFIIGGILIYVL